VGVPAPVTARDGRLVVEAAATGVPEPRICVLFRWLDGRFVDRRLTPAHLRAVGAATAELQLHADGWAPPPGFARPRADTMTTRAKVESIAPSAPAALAGDHPSPDDARAMIDFVGESVSTRDGELVRTAIEAIWGTTRELAAQRGSFGLIHGDLHQENYLFEQGRFRVIDFDDCGWGFDLYDPMVTTSELQGRRRYPELRDATLEAYAARRPLPPRYEHHLDMLTALRRLQVIAWILESRRHPAFRDQWAEWTREELDGLAAQLDGGSAAAPREEA
jgi:Ser/Thr protein kinase RdoA (MazF antagonist)